MMASRSSKCHCEQPPIYKQAADRLCPLLGLHRGRNLASNSEDALYDNDKAYDCLTTRLGQSLSR